MRQVLIFTTALMLIGAPISGDVIMLKVPETEGDDYCLNDGYVYGRDTYGIWLLACQGYNGGINDTFGTTIIGNRAYDLPEPDWYYRWKALLRFDLTEYAGTINSIKLFIYVWRKRGVGPWTPVEVVKPNTDWYPLSFPTEDDFGSAGTVVGSKSVASFTVGDYNSITLSPSSIELGSWLPLRLEDQDLDCFVIPDSWDTVEFYTRDCYGQADTTNCPFLIIDYTPAPEAVAGVRAHRGLIEHSEVLGSSQLKAEGTQ